MADSTLRLGQSPKSAPEVDISPRDIAQAYWDFHYEPISTTGLFLKRCLDLAIAVPALVILAPLSVLIALLIKLESRGPVLYRSLRVGKSGRPFICYKFRSMVADADELKEGLRRHNERNGPTFKMEDDPRLTRLGPFIRRYSIDELPQILNVARGEMSIVGPRPHPFDDVLRYEPEHMRRCVVKPGLTCLWQVKARRSPSFDINMALDMQYIENWSLWLDLRVIILTFAAVFRGDGR